MQRVELAEGRRGGHRGVERRPAPAGADVLVQSGDVGVADQQLAGRHAAFEGGVVEQGQEARRAVAAASAPDDVDVGGVGGFCQGATSFAIRAGEGEMLHGALVVDDDVEAFASQDFDAGGQLDHGHRRRSGDDADAEGSSGHWPTQNQTVTTPSVLSAEWEIEIKFSPTDDAKSAASRKSWSHDLNVPRNTR